MVDGSIVGITIILAVCAALFLAWFAYFVLGRD